MTIYRAFVGATFLLYATATWQGWEIGSAKREAIPAEMRHQPGGYRSYSFWRGGK